VRGGVRLRVALPRGKLGGHGLSVGLDRVSHGDWVRARLALDLTGETGFGARSDYHGLVKSTRSDTIRPVRE